MHIEIARAGRRFPAGGPAAPSAPALLVQVDGATVVEVAGFQGMPGVVHAGSSRMPAPANPATNAADPPAPGFFGQAINEPAPLLGGTAEAGSLVLVGVGGAVFCVTADRQGAWSLDTALDTPMSGRFDLGADGPKELLITSVDSAGNSRGIAGVFVLDTTPPLPPVLETVVVDRSAPLIRGRAEAASTVTVGLCGAIYSVAADVAGRWCLDLRDAAPVSGTLVFGPDGDSHVALACTDAAGNTSTAEGAFLLRSGARAETGAPRCRDPHTDAEHAALRAGMADTTRRLLAGLGSGLRPVRH